MIISFDEACCSPEPVCREDFSHHMFGLVACVALLIGLAGCAAKNTSAPLTELSGEVVYRERMALPDNAEVVVTLWEQLPGQESVAVSTLRITTERRSIPIPFRITRADGKQDKASYALTARIETRGTGLFATPAPVPVNFSKKTTAPIVLLTHRIFEEDASDARRIVAPASYEGERERPNGRLRVTLHLQPDHVYVLRQATIHDKGQQVHEETGKWHQIANGTALQLGGNLNTTLRLAVQPNGSLLFTDRTPPKGSGPFTLNRQAKQAEQNSAVWNAPRLLVGQYRHMADASTFRDCFSGVTYALQGGKDALPLQNAYLSKKRSSGEPLVVEIEATPVTPIPADHEGPLDILQVDRFHSIKNQSLCPSANSTPSTLLLADKRWKLLELYGNPVRVADNRPEPHVSFKASAPTKGQAFGSDGCNRFNGAYLLDASSLRFLQMASTLMMCAEEAEQSTRFHQALSETTGWRVIGDVLELSNGPKTVAIFEQSAL